VALVGVDADSRDPRTAALFTGSINLLKHLGVWANVREASAPIRAIRVVDQMGGILRAPETLFSAEEAGADAVQDGVLGYNVPNGPLAAALAEAVATTHAIDWGWRVRATALTPAADRATLTLADGASLTAGLVVAADGLGSVCRAGAGIGTQRWQHDQSALVTSFTHSRPHHDISSEFHRPAGPLTVVPMPGNASSLVWVDRPGVVDMLAALDEAAFRAELEAHLQGLLGVVREIAPRRGFPLSGLTAAQFGGNRVALVGEAGHVFPPIGAQGLNLGLRDVAVLADVVGSALMRGGDPGGADVLAAYDRARQGDVATRTMAVSVLGLSLTSGLPPVELGRGLGLHMLARLSPLKRRLIREGLAPGNVTPSLMLPPVAPLTA
jgi:2-octaprenyl-6-methoxyphenol hydroxylase